MNPLQDVFISYGRIDSKQFAQELSDKLAKLGYVAWFDANDIPLGVDYQKQIDDGIGKADNFLYVISPRSVNSPYCDLELELALKYKKRIIPLLHVEEISREIWQQRNSEGTDADWAAYQQAGKHRHSPNMKPEIRKINWIYFREDVDDFEESWQGLLEVLEREKDYVRQHTVLLNAALEWEQNQKQTQYLLIGEELQQAETWMTRRFEDIQPPVVLTDLHYEYITESIKNGNNLTTQVFLAHAEEDKETAEKIRRTLMRAGMTTWTHTNDIGPRTEDLRSAMARGVEEADNFLFLMSPCSLQSEYCQQELEVAVYFEKRIVVVLLASVDALTIPTVLQNQQYIDLTDNTSESDYVEDEDNLLRTLKQDADYYNEHKVLLTKALKWERQQYNACVLLQGYELQHALAWREIARGKNVTGLTPIQDKFIEASQSQTTVVLPDVFISYSSADADFARRLNDALQSQGKRTWFDQESIASGADFRQEIYQGIEKSNYFLFILSPRSINSPYCADEVNYAAKLNKRLVTVLYRPVKTAELHPELAKVQWIDFDAQKEGFNSSFKVLLQTLDVDPEYLRSHTRLLMRANEWRDKQRQDDYLLRGQDLQEAEKWWQHALKIDLKPTALQEEFISTSRKVSRNYRRILVTSLASLTVLCLASGIAIRQSVVAHRVREQAEHQARNAEIRAKAISVENLMASGLHHQALWAALKLGQEIKRYGGVGPLEPGTWLQAVSVLREAYHDEQGFLIYSTLASHESAVTSIRFSPDGKLVAAASDDGTVRLWNPTSNDSFKLLKGHRASVADIRFSPDGTTMASASDDGTVKLWDLTSGQELRSLAVHQTGISTVGFLPDGESVIAIANNGTVKLWNLQNNALQSLESREQGLTTASFSLNGATLAFAYENGLVKLWDLRSGKELQTLAGEKTTISSLSFSPDNMILATVDTAGIITLWNRNSGDIVQILKGYGYTINKVEFSSDGTLLASANANGTITLWDIRSGKELPLLRGHDADVSSVSFSPNGDFFASASIDGIVKFWNRSRVQQLQTFDSHKTAVSSVSFASNDSNVLASADFNGTIKLWNPSNGEEIRTLIGHNAPVWGVSFSADGTLLASASADRTIKLWDLESGEVLKTLTGHEAPVWSVGFSPDNTVLASASADRHVKLWDLHSGNEVKTFLGHRDWVNSVSFSADGALLASASDDGTVKLWNVATGREIRHFTGHRAPVWSVDFLPMRVKTGKTLGYVLASASADSTVKLWHSQSENELETLQGHSSLVTSIDVSPDGTTLASASADHTVQLWDISGYQRGAPKWNRRYRQLRGRKPQARNWRLDSLRFNGWKLQTLDDHSDRVTGVSFSPNGTTVASASDDGKVIIWDFDLNTLMAKACDSQQRYLLHGNPTAEQLEICEDAIASQPQKNS